MICRFPIDVERLIMERHFERFDALSADWLDEGAEAAVDGNPRRGYYLELMARRVVERGQEIAWALYGEKLRRLGLTP